jgi:hypothetical protein
MLGNALPDKEHCQILGEVIAVVKKKIVGLMALARNLMLEAERIPLAYRSSSRTADTPRSL